MRKALAYMAIGAIVATGVGGAVASAKPTGVTTVKFSTKTTQHGFVDQPPKTKNFQNPSIGDQFLFSDRLHQGKKTVGNDGGSCTVVHLHPARGLCIATFHLSDGQISAQALINFSRTSSDFKIEITGGTGNYKTARGFGANHNSTTTLYLYP